MVNPQQQAPPDTETRTDENFMNIPVDGIFGGVKPEGLRATIFTEERHPGIKMTGKKGGLDFDKIVINKKATINMDPITMKTTMKWLKEKVKQYEDQFGEIEIPGEGGRAPSGMEFR